MDFNKGFYNGKYMPPKKSKPRIEYGNNYFKEKRAVHKQETKVNEYVQSSRNYSIYDLNNYVPLTSDLIKGPFEEKVLIEKLSDYLFRTPSAFLPLNDVLVTEKPKGCKYEVDLLQDSLLLSHGLLIPVRYEVKNGLKNNFSKIRGQLTNINNVYPVFVEKSDDEFFDFNSRFNELFDNLGDILTGSIIYDSKNFHSFFRFNSFTVSAVITDILSYNFRNVIERDLMITAYSLFSNLGFFSKPLRDLTFSKGVLSSIDHDLSFSTYPLCEKGNNVLVYQSLEPRLINYESMISKSLGYNDLSYSVDYDPFTDTDSDASVFLDPNAQSSRIFSKLEINNSSFARRFKNPPKNLEVINLSARKSKVDPKRLDD